MALNTRNKNKKSKPLAKPPDPEVAAAAAAAVAAVDADTKPLANPPDPEVAAAAADADSEPLAKPAKFKKARGRQKKETVVAETVGSDSEADGCRRKEGRRRGIVKDK